MAIPLTLQLQPSNLEQMASASLMRQNNRNNASPSADRAWGGEALT
ncbi:MAG TPA: hypothetical protein VFF76_10180 [Holophagaceae bacterium]|jgi:hypothetical protein|nr:hypothetical protein [Holophagaceae bacterium]